MDNTWQLISRGVRAWSGRAAGPALLTVGHGAASAAEFTALLRRAGVSLVVDVRTAPVCSPTLPAGQL